MIDVTELRATLERAAVELPVEQIADAIGLCAGAQARLLARITMPSTSTTTESTGLVTAAVVATAFEVPVSQIYELSRQGRLPCVRLGRYVRYDLAELRRVLSQAPSSESAALGTRKKRSNSATFSTPATTLQPDTMRR